MVASRGNTKCHLMMVMEVLVVVELNCWFPVLIGHVYPAIRARGVARGTKVGGKQGTWIYLGTKAGINVESLFTCAWLTDRELNQGRTRAPEVDGDEGKDLLDGRSFPHCRCPAPCANASRHGKHGIQRPIGGFGGNMCLYVANGARRPWCWRPPEQRHVGAGLLGSTFEMSSIVRLHCAFIGKSGT